MRAVIWFTLVLSTQTYPPCELTPQTSARVGCSRIPEMPGPTVMRATGRSLTRSTTAMLPSAVLTYAFKRSPGRKKEARCSRKSKIAAPSSSTVVSEMTRAFRKRPFTTPVGQALRELILFSLSVDLPMQHCGDLPHLFGEFGKFLGQNRLHAVGESLVRLVVDFHQQSIRANGNGCARERQDFVAFAGAMAGVNQDRQVTASFHRRHDGQIQRGRHPPLQQYRLFGPSGALQQGKILHIARANLDHVRVFLDQIQALVVDGLGDNPKSEFLTHLRQNLQPRFPQSLKAVRGCPRLIRSPPKQPHSALRHTLRDGQRLLFALHCARPRHQSYFVSPDDYIPRRCGNPQDGVFLFGVAADQLVRL